MKRILILVSTICLNACQAFPTFNRGKTVERCALFIESEYVSKCRCHDYDPFKGRMSESVDRPIEYCHKFIAFSPDDWGKFVKWFGDIDAWIRDVEKRFNRASVK